MEIIFIGTGSGKTSLKRCHTSFLIHSSKYNILVEAGDGVSFALLNAGINFLEIDSILFSHFHPDHLSGIASLLNQMKMNMRKKELQIITHNNLLNDLKDLIKINLIFPERLGFNLKFLPYNYQEQLEIKNKISLLAKENSHLKKLSVFSNDSSNLQSSSFLLDVDNYKILYTGDLGGKDDIRIFEQFSSDFIICECTHIPFSEILRYLDLFNPKKLFLIHIPDEIELELKTWFLNLPIEQSEKIIITKDRMKFSLK